MFFRLAYRASPFLCSAVVMEDQIAYLEVRLEFRFQLAGGAVPGFCLSLFQGGRFA